MADEIEAFEVQKIISKRTINNPNGSISYQYFVKWKGYSAEQNTWQPAYNLTGCKKLVTEFNKKYHSDLHTVKEDQEESKSSGPPIIVDFGSSSSDEEKRQEKDNQQLNFMNILTNSENETQLKDNFLMKVQKKVIQKIKTKEEQNYDPKDSLEKVQSDEDFNVKEKAAKISQHPKKKLKKNLLKNKDKNQQTFIDFTEYEIPVAQILPQKSSKQINPKLLKGVISKGKLRVMNEKEAKPNVERNILVMGMFNDVKNKKIVYQIKEDEVEDYKEKEWLMKENIKALIQFYERCIVIKPSK